MLAASRPAPPADRADGAARAADPEPAPAAAPASPPASSPASPPAPAPRAIAPPDEALAGRVRAAQIGAIRRFTPLALMINLLNAVVIMSVVGSAVPPALLWAWVAAVWLTAAFGTRSWLRSRRVPPRPTASRRGIRRAMVHGGALAAVWAVAPAMFFPAVDPSTQLILGIMSTGMLCAGGFALATLLPAAAVYVTIVGLGSVLGLLVSDNGHKLLLGTLLVMYVATILRSVWASSKLFTEHFIAEATLIERGQVIELLLAEFEENGSDWLFELGPDGTIRRPSARFCEVSGRDAGALEGLDVAALVHEEDRAALLAALAQRAPFRDLPVRVPARGRLGWWSLTAKPVGDEGGGFLGWRGVGADITTARLAHDRMAWMAATDPLTGLPNRAAFRDAIAAALAEGAAAPDAGPARGRGVAVGFIDLDQFKTINDTLGHPAGDTLLLRVAETLRGLATGAVSIGRLGGDEFGFVMRGVADVAEAEALGRRVVALLTRTHDIAGARASVGASVGIAWEPEPGRAAASGNGAGGDGGARAAVDDLVRNADLALYAAKDGGRGRVALYTGTMHAEAEDRRRLQEDLADAPARGELELHYQPVVDARTGRLRAFEALLRWRHPTRGLIPPGAFVPLAEATGLIVPVGEWVLRRACLDARRFPPDVSVSVNVSPAQMGRSRLAAAVVEALDAAGLPPGRLEIEVTEAVFAGPGERAAEFLRAMRALGVRIALDDFGTGYSSLGYLARYPIDTLKIDRSFVSGEAPLPHREAIIRSVVGLARALGMDTTAEGVETRETRAWVAALGCASVQGFGIARPLPLEDALAAQGLASPAAEAAGGLAPEAEPAAALARRA